MFHGYQRIPAETRLRIAGAAAAAIVVLLAWSLSTPAGAAAAAARVTVDGTAAPGQAGVRLGDEAASTRLSFAVTLPLRDRVGLDAFIAAVSNPKSPDYGEYLTPAEFAARYAPTRAQVNSVTGYLRSQGVLVARVSANRTVVDASATVAQIGRAFGTSIGRYHDSRLGRDYYANDSAVSVPEAIAPDVLGVVGLDDHFVPAHPPIPNALPELGSGPAGGYTPAELKGAYDVAALASGGFTGSGQNVGLFELDGFQQSNITTYDNEYALGSSAPTVTPVDGGTTLGSGEIEVELDIEVIQAIAPAAHITVWEGPNSNQGVIDTYNAMATSDTTPSNSTSWGGCEADSSTATINSESSIFAQMAAQGQSLFAASGDDAAYDCGTSGQLGVDNPADDPNVTGVGGTNLQISGTSYGSESAWHTSATEGGGGGVSTIFAKPSWQSAPGLPANCTKRCVPDVSSDADPASGYSIYSQGSWQEVGGTSAAAPMWAGFTAVYNQDATAAGHAKLGYANPTLYGLASASQTFAPFHDVTSGFTSTATHWPATAGYDLATGLGSYDANNLARDLLGGVTNDFSISASPSTVTVTAGGSGTSSISTAVAAGSAGSVSLTVSGAPAGVTATLSPTSVTAGTSSTLTLQTTSSTAAGTYTMTVSGAEGSKAHSTPVTLTVNAASGGNTVTVANPGSQTGTVGSAASLQISASDSASGQTLSYSASGLPAGLGISSTSGVISGTPTAAGTSSVTVTVRDGTGATGSTTFSWTIATAGGSCTAAQLLGDPGFESGTTQTSWSASSGVINGPNDTNEPPHSGAWDAWLDGYSAAHTDTLSQAVTIPAGCTASTLSFWLHIDTAQTGSSAKDTLTVQLLNASGVVLTTLATYSNVNAASGYLQKSFSVGAFAGQSVTLKLTGVQAGTTTTSFVLDDFALNTAGGSGGGNTVTVTNPGSQTTAAGSAASLQISATDSASGQTLSYSASGLPAGLGIGSSTGLISGTPTTAGSSSVTITVKDGTGATGTATFTWTITAAGGCTATQLLQDPGFESGTSQTAWTASNAVINGPNDTSEPPHSGAWDAWLDGYGVTHTDTLSQPVTIPATCTTATLSFWLHIDTAETTTTTNFDKLTVQILNGSGTVLTTLHTYGNLDHNTGYAQHSFSLTPYIGQKVTLKFTGTEDSSLQTSFVIDDTAINVS